MTTLAASTALMLLVLGVRGAVRRWIGPGLAYALWALPAARMILPPLAIDGAGELPLAGPIARKMLVLASGTAGGSDVSGQWALPSGWFIMLAIWAAGAAALLGIHAIRHFAFCHRLRATGTASGRVGKVRIIAADVDGPVAFGVFRRFVAVPRDFALAYDEREQALALAHECAHHARGDLVANWAALVMLAVHWWNPVAWIASRAFHDDQEFAADAHVLARAGRSAVAPYAALLAKAAGVGAPPVCNLNARSSLKGRLMMLDQKPRSMRAVVIGGSLMLLCGGAALAASAVQPGRAPAAAGKQAVTIAVKPDGSGAYALIVGGRSVAPGAALPGGLTLPASFGKGGGCDLKAAAKPSAHAIKGIGGEQTYTVMCASAAPASVRATLDEGLASLRKMRASVATQQASAAFPETERAHALGAIDRSIREVQGSLAGLG
nr:M56 family metallopeptidase [Sphingomonas quercus]